MQLFKLNATKMQFNLLSISYTRGDFSFYHITRTIVKIENNIQLLYILYVFLYIIQLKEICLKFIYVYIHICTISSHIFVDYNLTCL